MTDDLVNLLRRAEDAEAKLAKAANEIERLRTALRMIAECTSYAKGDVVDIARSALKEGRN